LIPISRDHHFGLLLVWKIRKGIDQKVDKKRIVEYIRYFFEVHLSLHFSLEEEYLFSYLAKNDRMRKEAEAQHKELREKFDQLNDGVCDEHDLEEFAKELESHIRFEERKLFPYMQVELTAQDLEELGNSVEKTHQKVRENWHDPFWEN